MASRRSPTTLESSSNADLSRSGLWWLRGVGAVVSGWRAATMQRSDKEQRQRRHRAEAERRRATATTEVCSPTTSSTYGENVTIKEVQYSNGTSYSSYKHVWPELRFGWKIVMGTIIGFLGAAFGSVGGVGGGGIFVPMLTLILGFDTKSSAAVSKYSICKSKPLEHAGLPLGVLNILSCFDPTVGASLASHME